MRLVTAPQYHYPDNNPTLFLAGGITDCPNWQAELIEYLRDTDLTIFNPRRPYFPTSAMSAAKQQIEWEFEHIQRADAVSFWFPKETLFPIVLYELGFQLGMCHKEITHYGVNLSENKRLFIGCDPAYKRLFDVQTQTALVLGSDFPIVFSVKELSKQIKKSLR